MLRRKEDTIDADPVFAADLKELGFFINDLGQFRMIGAPEKEYIFHATNNERVNEMRREGMQECQRRETEKRLFLLGINRIYLPEFTITKPDGPHVPILAPAPEVLKVRKRIIVVVNDTIQDIGILAYRELQRGLGVNGGSAVDFVKRIIKRSATGDAAKKYEDIFNDGFKLEDDADTPALVVLNTAQLLYSHKHNKALTLRSWSAMPRRSVTHDMINIHEENSVEGHRNPKEHVKSVFEDVLFNPARVAPDAQIYLIALESGTETMLSILGEEFEKYSSRVTAMALVHSLMYDAQIQDPHLLAFLHQRTREWRHSDLTNDPQNCTALPENYCSEGSPPTEKIIEHIAWNEDVSKGGALSTITNALHRLAVSVTPTMKKEEPASVAPVAEADLWSSGQAAICPTFAGGPESTGECILTYPAVQEAVLSFFEEVAQNPENYCNPKFKIYSAAPQPSPDNPLALDPEDPNVAGFSTLVPEMTLEQAEVDMAKEHLKHMKSSLQACSANVPELHEGRKKLVAKIAKQQVKIQELEQAALATGGLTAGQAPKARANWKPPKEGVPVEFLGATVDSELLKGAGMVGTAAAALEALGDDGI
ncbi:hypothetical protein CC86DRAFT_361760 [Ophiobolus disseminans]|uniref:Arb2 domain-containing protein n=1 Tax=Ophiobolus disseminans TaxID=1469910 RepID=A0A6A6ZGI6_9PLEO|nr:hypothetical protein CC86DRAFT_361760 [Ophiobolus disseminans]